MTKKITIYKFLVAILILYPTYYAEAFGGIPFLLIGTYAVLDAVFLIDFIIKKKCVFERNISIISIVIFYALSFVFGFVVTIDRSFFLSKIFIGIQYLFLMLVVIEICRYEKTCEYIIRLVFVTSIVYILTALIRNITIFNRLVISQNANANSLGMLCFSCACLSLYFYKKYKFGWILSVICIPLSLYTVALSGSRKYLFIIGISCLVFFVFNFRNQIKNNIIKVFLAFAVLLILFFVFRSTILSFWNSSIILTRIQNGSSIDEDRWVLYKKAFDIFEKNKFFGVGYQCFQLYENVYTHSAYAEVLSCTGIVGFVPWIVFYISIMFKTLSNFISNRNSWIAAWSLMWLISQVILDFFSISLYMPVCMAMFGVLISISFYQIENPNISVIKGASNTVFEEKVDSFESHSI